MWRGGNREEGKEAKLNTVQRVEDVELSREGCKQRGGENL